EEAVQPDIILSGSALRKQNHSISFSIQQCQPPGTKDSYTHPTTPSAGRSGGVLTCLTKSPDNNVSQIYSIDTFPRLFYTG
ncbi:hypothetical protein PM027_08160, partial [[Clostridium] symbiosum]|uniref:hypothetical protein n=1 Tax=Clostridium symbiosum TaxID=1512 RepID=UPI001A9B2F2A